MLMLVPAFHLGYYFIYGAAIDQYIVGVLLTTDSAEASEFLTAVRLAKYLAVVVVMVVLLTLSSIGLYRLSQKCPSTSSGKLQKNFQ